VELSWEAVRVLGLEGRVVDPPGFR
jgi:hypothetical protein